MSSWLLYCMLAYVCRAYSVVNVFSGCKRTRLRWGSFRSYHLWGIQGAPWSWKVMENDDNVMEFLLLHW